jgi:hypothetical protein
MVLQVHHQVVEEDQLQEEGVDRRQEEEEGRRPEAGEAEVRQSWASAAVVVAVRKEHRHPAVEEAVVVVLQTESHCLAPAEERLSGRR